MTSSNDAGSGTVCETSDTASSLHFPTSPLTLPSSPTSPSLSPNSVTASPESPLNTFRPLSDACALWSRRRQNRLANFTERCKDNPTVVIDCNFERYQTEKELKRLTQQLMFSYGINTSAETPIKLHLTGMGPNLCQNLDRISGWRQWMCHFDSQDWTALFPLEQVIYLTADAEKPLDSFESDKVYIIGGMVDRNRHKGMTAMKADEFGVETRRLPLQEHITMSGSKVITVNQMLEIIHLYMKERDWKLALATVIPERKLQYKPRIKRRMEEKKAPSA